MASKPTDSLADYLKNAGLPPDVAEELAKPPFKLSTVSRFANYFDDQKAVQEKFLATSKWKESGDVISDLKQCWREAAFL